jgi:hypothetical protein
MNYKELEQIVNSQGRTQEAKNLLKRALDKCKREKKTPREAFTTINQLIVNPTSMGVC